MNAILREKYEVPVLTNESIEVHLSYLRPAVDAVQAELPLLRRKIEALDEKLTGKIEALDEKLSARIESLSVSLNEKIDQANKDRAAGDAALGEKIDQANRDRAAGDATLGEKIDKLTEVVMKMQGSQEGLKWFIGSLTVLATGISIAKSLDWI